MAGETVTIVRRSKTDTDAHGLPIYAEVSIPVTGVLVAPGGSNEPVLTGADPVDGAFTLYFPAGTVVEALDKFLVRGSEWVKDGTSDDWGVGVVVKVRQRNG